MSHFPKNFFESIYDIKCFEGAPIFLKGDSGPNGKMLLGFAQRGERLVSTKNNFTELCYRRCCSNFKLVFSKTFNRMRRACCESRYLWTSLTKTTKTLSTSNTCCARAIQQRQKLCAREQTSPSKLLKKIICQWELWKHENKSGLIVVQYLRSI